MVANMVGTGVFTSLGFQLQDLSSGFVILLLWATGGLIALCGALCYAELGAALPRSGGEYRFLGELYHPALGFLSGWISLTVGFAAPTALAAVTFGAYLESVLPALPRTLSGCLLVCALALAHSRSRHRSGLIQEQFTAIKLAVILLFCVALLAAMDTPSGITMLPAPGDLDAVLSSGFAIGLIYVNYAYTGWNAATYLSGELETPASSLPRVLGFGTLLVAGLYLLLNASFLISTPAEQIVGRVEVGYVVAEHVFGVTGAALAGGVLALLLISTVSAMIVAGPRVLHAVGSDYAAFRWLGRTRTEGLPVNAIATQAALSLLLIVTASFESILVFSGLILGLNTLLTVAGVFILRHRTRLPRPFAMPAYPWPPLVFLTLMGWTLVYVLLERPVEAGFALLLITTGALLYLWTIRRGDSASPTGKT